MTQQLIRELWVAKSSFISMITQELFPIKRYIQELQPLMQMGTIPLGSTVEVTMIHGAILCRSLQKKYVC